MVALRRGELEVSYMIVSGTDHDRSSQSFGQPRLSRGLQGEPPQAGDSPRTWESVATTAHVHSVRVYAADSKVLVK